MNITGTLINIYHICRRQVWLHANGIRMEATSDIVADGKLTHETSYQQRSEKYTEIMISSILPNGLELMGKIDFYDTTRKVVHEVKRSDKSEDAHEWQAKYYLWLLELNGTVGAQAIIEYPKLRQTKNILLTEPDKSYLQMIIQDIHGVSTAEVCPSRINSKICQNCSYYDLCYIEE